MKYVKEHSQKKLIEKIFEEVVKLDKEFKSAVFKCAQGTKRSNGEMLNRIIHRENDVWTSREYQWRYRKLYKGCKWILELTSIINGKKNSLRVSVDLRKLKNQRPWIWVSRNDLFWRTEPMKKKEHSSETHGIMWSVHPLCQWKERTEGKGENKEGRVARHFLSLTKDINLSIQDVQRAPRRLNTKRSTSRYIHYWNLKTKRISWKEQDRKDQLLW